MTRSTAMRGPSFMRTQLGCNKDDGVRDDEEQG